MEHRHARALPALMVAPRLIAIAALIAAGVAWGLAESTTALELPKNPCRSRAIGQPLRTNLP